MTEIEIVGMAISNADTAIDQADSFESLDDAIESYSQNVSDTLFEAGLTVSNADWAYILGGRAFASRVAEVLGSRFMSK